jgi:hypothetical protein
MDITSSSEYFRPLISIALVGHTAAHLPQTVHFVKSVWMPSSVNKRAFSGQISTHDEQPIHFFLLYSFSVLNDWLSGL